MMVSEITHDEGVVNVLTAANTVWNCRINLCFYHITIENLRFFGAIAAQKVDYIRCSRSERIVEGEGVVGVQPSIPSGDQHEYTSSCLMNTAFGTMKGHYTFERLVDGVEFDVTIPLFQLEVPYLLS
jgi:ApaG protein